MKSFARRISVAAAAFVAACGGGAGPIGPAGPPAPDLSLGRDVRIGVVESASSITLGSSGDWSIVERTTGRSLATGTGGSATVTKNTNGGFRVAAGSATNDATGPVLVSSSTNAVTINGRAYRGRGEVRTNAAGALAGINELPVELYLYGVVPRELGPVAFPEVEGQKVQAVAARTYALANIGRRAADGYDLRATTDDQVYGGLTDEHSVSTAAVDATRGMVMTHSSALINARYSSTSGGHTADNEESFNEVPVVYWRGVSDMPATDPRPFSPTIEAFKASPYIWDLRTPPAPFDLDRPRYHRWTFEWTPSELSSIISTYAGKVVGTVRALNVVQRGTTGRIVTLEYVTDSGTFAASRGTIRSSLKYINSSGALVNLPSALFFIEPVSGTAGAFRVWGGGFGHGVGMAQVGAVLMAKAGKKYDEILRHYYQGGQLTKAY